MSTSSEEVREVVQQWVTFMLGNEKYGVSVMKVQEVLRYSDIAPVPGAPPYVLGIINLRGNVVTVVDTRQRFGLMPKETDESSRIVIIDVQGQVIGMLVDSVAEVVDLKESDIESAPDVGNEDSSKFILGITNFNQELLILIDLDKLLDDEVSSDGGLF